jgi:putative aldouronate transport system permease protein
MIALRGERPPWLEKQSGVGRLTKILVLAVIVFVVIYPFLSVAATSLASQQDIDAGGGLVLIPLHPSLDAYRTILRGGVITRAMLISIGITSVGTVLSMVATVTMAYALSRPGVVASRAILLLVLFTLLIAPGIIPSYLLVRQLGLLNSFAALVLPGLIHAYNLLVLRSFFMNIPQELIDSARLDGAGDAGILLRVVLPLSKAVLAVIALFYAVTYWNAFFNAILYINDIAKYPLQNVLRLYVLQGTPLPGAISLSQDISPPPAQAVQMAVVMIALVPILLVYPFLQRYFTRGVLTGAVKG